MATDELPDHTDYLARRVLNDGETVNYRNVSRALKVHVNIAKRMLFDFHQRQNRKKPKTVHAIYLLKGRDRPPAIISSSNQDGEDAVMQSSPPFSSSAIQRPDGEEPTEREVIDTFRITLAKEDDLAKAKDSFAELRSVHIYSLSPAIPNDLEVLTDCSRRVAVASINEDPLKDWKQYGIIQNEHVKRRALKRPPPAPRSAPEQKPALTSSKPPSKTINAAPTNARQDDSTAAAHPDLKRSESSEQSRPPSRASTSSKATSKQPTVKRESSNLMRAFANAPAKKIRAEPVKPEDDGPATILSDEEADAEDMDLDEGAITIDTGHNPKKSKKAREAELQAMMDAEDEDMPDVRGQVEPAGPDGESPNEPRDHDASRRAETAGDGPRDLDARGKQGAAAGDGRRRGRRRVVKKRTVKDDEGYLVTREEAVWESFSEDEPVAKRAVAAKSAAGPDKKVAGAKKGQGSIMNFFGKK